MKNKFEYELSRNGILKLDIHDLIEGKLELLNSPNHGSAHSSGNLIFYTPQNDFIGKDEFTFFALVNESLFEGKIVVDVVSTFKPKAHILVLLGEELIKTPVMAIYELIKNSYDADSKEVTVEFENIENIERAQITITDFGTGINQEILENVWFEPGTDFRKPINLDGTRKINRSPIFGRIPMGEKGVGRFAVHKLGHTIKLISRPSNIEVDKFGKAKSIKLFDYEVNVEIDWRSFSQSKYLEDVKINWHINKNKDTFLFKDTHGTRIVIGNLKETWTRGMARQLKRQTLSMLSPKNDKNKFEIILDFGNWWLNDIPSIDDILDRAPYKLTAFVEENFDMTFEYQFKLKNNEQIGSHIINKNSTLPADLKKYKHNIKGELRPYYINYLEEKEYSKIETSNLLDNYDSEINKIPFGPMMVEFYSYDLDGDSIRDYSESINIVRSAIKDHAGVKVFKKDLRVFDYGDPGNDWLGLDIKRINNKSWFSNNQNIGFLYLDDEKSGQLIEKTNREGFINNFTYDFFIVLVVFILDTFRAERHKDREKWIQFNKKGNKVGLENDLNNFKAIISNTDLTNDEKKAELLIEAERIEGRYKKDKETLLIPAGVGMTASFAMHEIEKLVPRMQETVLEDPIDKIRIADQVYELKDYVEGILSVLKKGGNKPISLIESINQAVKNYAVRLSNRNIDVKIIHDQNIEMITCDKRLLITMIMNLIDNSIYWLNTVYKKNKSILIKTQLLKKGVSIIIADNGPGFKDSVEDIVRPFFTRREGGIGIGMYLVDTVMIQYGKLNIIEGDESLSEMEIPLEYNGAVVELIFNKKQL